MLSLRESHIVSYLRVTSESHLKLGSEQIGHVCEKPSLQPMDHCPVCSVPDPKEVHDAFCQKETSRAGKHPEMEVVVCGVLSPDRG